jgi:hypothetical protein
MWVTQLCLEIEREPWTKFNILRSQFDKLILTFLDELSGKKWIKNGINFFTDRFNHKHVTILDGHFDSLQPVLLVELDNNHFRTFSSLNPFLALELWINHESISTARNSNSSIFK